MSGNRNMLCVVARADELQVRAVLLGQNDVERSRTASHKGKALTRIATSGSIRARTEDDRSRAGKAGRRIKETIKPICLSPHPTASCATFRSRLLEHGQRSVIIEPAILNASVMGSGT